MKEVILNNENPTQKIWISNDIDSLHIKSIKTNISTSIISDYIIECKISNYNGSNKTEFIYVSDQLNDNNEKYIFDWSDSGLFNDIELPIKYVEFSSQKDIKDSWIRIKLQFRNYHTIEDPLKKFDEHLSERQNSKILFSGAFGQGKTTFLRLFFEQLRHKYNAFHLFPVNYSISENKDILEYIKCEILIKLFEEKDIEFDKKKISYLKTLPEFALNHADKILAPFLRLIPLVGGDMFKIYNNLKKLSDEYFGEHNKRQINDEKKTIDYIQAFFEREGSIYEDNFYTQLIRQLLEQAKFKSNKDNILIIDDLDRIEPSHIFRILNVFAAHFDDKDYTSFSNKFGFDKVIIVCDYSNLKKIFGHMYGSNTDFNGYINKFFSYGIFRFSNIEAAYGLINNVNKSNQNSPSTFKALLFDLFLSSNLTLREILTIKKYNYDSEIKYGLNKTDQEYISIFKLFIRLFTVSDFRERIKICRDNYDTEIVDRNLNYDYLTQDAFIELYSNEIHDSKIIFEYNEKKYILKTTINFKNIMKSNMKYLCPESLKLIDKNNVEVSVKEEFTEYDFYTIIIKLLDKYQYKLI